MDGIFFANATELALVLEKISTALQMNNAGIEFKVV